MFISQVGNLIVLALSNLVYLRNAYGAYTDEMVVAIAAIVSRLLGGH